MIAPLCWQPTAYYNLSEKIIFYFSVKDAELQYGAHQGTGWYPCHTTTRDPAVAEGVTLPINGSRNLIL
jgi:hypothetical protein